MRNHSATPLANVSDRAELSTFDPPWRARSPLAAVSLILFRIARCLLTVVHPDQWQDGRRVIRPSGAAAEAICQNHSGSAAFNLGASICL